ncbi:MAG: peptidylprolyl isomerase [Clostridia bacterium]|nr:peptidylprolyl isomerase [Clostridia bacterium]
MKRTTKTALRLVALVLCALMLLPALASCSSLGTPVMSLGSTEITANMLQFLLSRYKATILQRYGNAIKNEYVSLDAFLDTKVEGSDKTYDQLFTEHVRDNAKTYLAALHLYDELGLSLPDEVVASVDERMEYFVEDQDHAGGSRQEFNTILAAYGVNYDILREMYLMEEKINQLQDHLFGKGGEKQITAADKEAYYKANYVRMRQVCIFINNCPKVDEDGKYVTDSNGMFEYREMTEEENEAAKDKAQEAYDLLKNGTSFESVLEKYDENTADDEHTHGFYLSAESVSTSDAALIMMYEELCDMDDGEYRLVESAYGMHIIQKIPLDDGAYNLAVNEDFFTFWDSKSQTYVNFEYHIRTPLFLEYIGEKLDAWSADIKLDDALISEYTIKTVKANYYY